MEKKKIYKEQELKTNSKIYELDKDKNSIKEKYATLDVRYQDLSEKNRRSTK